MNIETVELGVKRKNGDYVETWFHDLTRVGNPYAGKIVECEGQFLVVFDGKTGEVAVRDNFNSAVNFAEQKLRRD